MQIRYIHNKLILIPKYLYQVSIPPIPDTKSRMIFKKMYTPEIIATCYLTPLVQLLDCLCGIYIITKWFGRKMDNAQILKDIYTILSCPPPKASILSPCFLFYEFSFMYDLYVVCPESTSFIFFREPHEIWNYVLFWGGKSISFSRKTALKVKSHNIDLCSHQGGGGGWYTHAQNGGEVLWNFVI